MDTYDAVIVGGGASGTALLYALSRYTNLARIALIEKYPEVGSVNSNAKNNSQTLHVGDIETNYSMEKVREVRPAAMMVKRYADSLPEKDRAHIIQKVQKMVLAVGEKEVKLLEARYPELKTVFPELEKLDAAGIEREEPNIMRGRSKGEKVLALLNREGYAVNYGELSKALVKDAKAHGRERVDLFLGSAVTAIERADNFWRLSMGEESIRALSVVVDADAYSLGFAKRLGYGKHFSLIPVAGSFYFTPPLLKGKVYRVQEPRMPFAAVHGDPDLTAKDATRFGPTARFYPVLEARRLATLFDFFAASGLHRIETWMSFASILLEPIRFWYLLKNFFYDLPIVGVHFFLPEVKKIIPSLRARDLTRARGYGGMRLQRVDTTTRELLLGEGKIVGENIIFNMTPSPGASVCLHNALRDTEKLAQFLPEMRFDKKRMLKDLCEGGKAVSGEDVSLRESYAS